MERRRSAHPLRIVSISLAAFAVAVAGSAQAVTLYKFVDRDGRVSYADRVPKGFDGKVVSLEINPDALNIQPPTRAEMQAEREENERILRERPAQPDDSQVRNARKELEDAKSAFAAARESASPEDWIYFGCRRPPGGCRAPRPQYEARLARLEAQVKVDEQKLAEAERRYRRE